MSIAFSGGIIVLVESDNEKEWWLAKDWQAQEFIKAMEFGTMKSMGGYPVPIEYTTPFTVNTFTYRFIIENEWGPCYIENMNTTKKRQIIYTELGKFTDSNHNTIISNID
mgnify:CR=1 FL=1